jgi:hypothetical protein
LFLTAFHQAVFLSPFQGFILFFLLFPGLRGLATAYPGLCSVALSGLYTVSIPETMFCRTFRALYCFHPRDYILSPIQGFILFFVLFPGLRGLTSAYPGLCSVALSGLLLIRSYALPPWNNMPEWKYGIVTYRANNTIAEQYRFGKPLNFEGCVNN